MKEDAKSVLYAMAYPTTIMVLVLIMSGFVMYYGQKFFDIGETTTGFVIFMSGAILALGAVLYWDVSSEVRLLRKDINDLKKTP